MDVPIKLRTAICLFVLLPLFTQCVSLEEALAPRRTKDTPKERTTTTTRPDRTTTNNVKDVSNIRRDVIEYAQQFVGTKYKYGGRSPRSGFDCSGFTHYVMNNFDIELPVVSRVQETYGRSIRIRDVQPGDLVFFRKSKRGKVFHVALVVDNDPDGIKVVHSTNRGVVVDNITHNTYWAPKLSSARSIIEE
jgi:cell wall-associated NlpC family hydrolase